MNSKLDSTIKAFTEGCKDSFAEKEYQEYQEYRNRIIFERKSK